MSLEHCRRCNSPLEAQPNLRPRDSEVRRSPYGHLKQEGKEQGGTYKPIFNGIAAGGLPAVSMSHTAVHLRDSCKGP